MKTTLVIFGVTGDLSQRKLLPALREIMQLNEFANIKLVGVSRKAIQSEHVFGSLKDKATIYSMDLAKASSYQQLWTDLQKDNPDQILIYLSVPPSASSQIVQLLGENNFADSRVKLLLEKPFGVGLESAKSMSSHLTAHFNESQLYRIDHYMAKEMAQNIVAFRSYNAIFSHIWSNSAIDRIEIDAFEKIDIEGRAQFYEQTGALRDILQGHLMQLLALILMRIPENLDWEQVPRLRLEALQKLKVADPSQTIRAQYSGYKDEVDNQKSTTETFVSTTLYSHDENWQGVPITLRTGKALDKKSTQVRVFFKKFHASQTDCLVFRIQPHEGVSIALQIKKPGYDAISEERRLSFDYPEDTQLPEAYEQVIVSAIRSQEMLFTLSDEIIRSWEILYPIVSEWSFSDDDIIQYKKGSSVHDIIALAQSDTNTL